MNNNKINNNEKNKAVLPTLSVERKSSMKAENLGLPILTFTIIGLVLLCLIHIQKTIIKDRAEHMVEYMSEHLANDIGNTIDYSEISIRAVAGSISDKMTSDTLENPSEIINPLVENTPFGAIEYIRADGMNVMNIGEPFDASDRGYYIEGIKGNSGIWNNYHPKTSKETLVNFYTPLIYDNRIVGVITGYIGATTQIAPRLEMKFYGEDAFGLLVDENMVISSTTNNEFEKDLTLAKFLARFDISEEQIQTMHNILENETKGVIPFKNSEGEGRVCVKAVPGTSWNLAIIIPPRSFNNILGEQTKYTAIAIIVISVVVLLYASVVLLSHSKRRKAIAIENAMLEENNRIFNEENRRAFAEISEIRDIISSANMGTWKIELVDGEEPRMYVDDKMKELLGISGIEYTPEEAYTAWFNNVMPEAVPSVLESVNCMKEGNFDENTYKWLHPQKGVRYVRCGGTAEVITGGFSLRGYHYDVDEVVRKEQQQMSLLRDALNEKKEYYATLGALGDTYYSMHVIDLRDDTVVEFASKNEVKEIVNHKNGAAEMMRRIITATTTDDFLDEVLNFTELTTLSDRMQGKNIITREFIGKNFGWFSCCFITMEKDESGRPTKVIFATRNINEEKQERERLIKKSQTDELTGLLNRRAYEEEIYACNDVPKEDNFVYISLDLNGLKVINDSLGHTAGDEMIVGSSRCMKSAFGSHSKIYRIGGDEFVVILFCDKLILGELLANFDNILDNWSGKVVDKLSISYGYASKAEFPDASIRELAVKAEERMYSDKTAHYRKMGVDRRGQVDAHKALCDLYTKILRINLTDDSFQIVNMDAGEQTEEKGFSEKISTWLTSFGTSGQVHPDDLEEYLAKTDLQYLKDYFSNNKTSLSIFYRRKYGDAFKQVVMDIIPANDYSEDNVSLFLYVKNIDR